MIVSRHLSFLLFSSGTESVSVVTDGSGFVTGLALQQLKHEKSLVVRENDQLKTRMQKIRGELMAEKEKINKERCVCVCVRALLYCSLVPTQALPAKERERGEPGNKANCIVLFNLQPIFCQLP